MLRSFVLYCVVERRDCTLKDMMKRTETMDSKYTKFLKLNVPYLAIPSNKVNVTLTWLSSHFLQWMLVIL